MPEFKIKSNSIHEQFLRSTAKIQIFGGGFANGKTATSCVKAIQLAKDYPGSNGLIARSTYPKLQDTVQREFFKWLPKNWIKKFTKTPVPTLELVNGSTVNFRHVQQGGKSQTTTTSNLLSATYDWILIDQIDDPEFVHKDFTDILGRLRGTTVYDGNNPSMPKNGPRWLMVTLNPTRNWFYKEYVAPILEYYKTKRLPDKLKVQLDKYNAILKELNVPLITDINELIQLVQGSTYENAQNLGADYMATMHAMYSGMLADRYIKGDWGAFQGLIYPMYDQEIHMRSQGEVERWIFSDQAKRWIEGFDYGQRVHQCYILALVGRDNTVCGVDGFREREMSPEEAVKRMKSIRKEWKIPVDTTQMIYADPSIFARRGGEYKTVGRSIADIYMDSGRGVFMQRGNNDIENGILKVGSYLTQHKFHVNPFTERKPGPFLYFNYNKLGFVDDEITEYFYKQPDDPNSEEEIPIDKNDHAMDTLKYMLTGMPELKVLIPKQTVNNDMLFKWQEAPGDDNAYAA